MREVARQQRKWKKQQRMGSQELAGGGLLTSACVLLLIFYFRGALVAFIQTLGHCRWLNPGGTPEAGSEEAVRNKVEEMTDRKSVV